MPDVSQIGCARASRARQALPLVAIVGRPNVGKSTLFNRLTRSRRSIVGDEPGITRDRIYGEYEWAGRQFRLVDTGGIVPDDPELIPTEIYNQAKVALEEADALVLVVDARTELASPDYDLVQAADARRQAGVSGGEQGRGRGDGGGGGEFSPAGNSRMCIRSARSMGWALATCWMRLRRRFRTPESARSKRRRAAEEAEREAAEEASPLERPRTAGADAECGAED